MVTKCQEVIALSVIRVRGILFLFFFFFVFFFLLLLLLPSSKENLTRSSLSIEIYEWILAQTSTKIVAGNLEGLNETRTLARLGQETLQ
jgi:hypothetical protein